jgi:short-subunit dehydrogenase
MDLENPGKALITGASSGIGLAYAQILAEQGFDLIIVARRKDRLEKLKVELEKQHGINVQVVRGDLAKPEDIKRIESLIKTLKNLDVLVNNAGFGIGDNFLFADGKVPIETYVNMLSVHCRAPMQFMHAALPKMVENNRGVVYNISSTASLILHGSKEPMYHSTKAFLSAFTEMVQLKLNFMKSKVKLKAICPGETKSEIFGPDWEYEGEDFKHFMEADDVVKISLDSYKNKDICIIPGDAYVNQVKEWREVAAKKPGRYFSENWSKTGIYPETWRPD